MIPHTVFSLATAVLLSIALAMTEDRPGRERLFAAARVFLWCTASVLGGGWLMHWIHG